MSMCPACFSGCVLYFFRSPTFSVVNGFRAFHSVLVSGLRCVPAHMLVFFLCVCCMSACMSMFGVSACALCWMVVRKWICLVWNCLPLASCDIVFLGCVVGFCAAMHRRVVLDLQCLHLNALRVHPAATRLTVFRRPYV